VPPVAAVPDTTTGPGGGAHLGVREVEAVELAHELLAVAHADAQQAAHQLPHDRRYRVPLQAPGSQCSVTANMTNVQQDYSPITGVRVCSVLRAT
jgi:hypothetical protein